MSEEKFTFENKLINKHVILFIKNSITYSPVFKRIYHISRKIKKNGEKT